MHESHLQTPFQILSVQNTTKRMSSFSVISFLLVTHSIISAVQAYSDCVFHHAEDTLNLTALSSVTIKSNPDNEKRQIELTPCGDFLNYNDSGNIMNISSGITQNGKVVEPFAKWEDADTSIVISSQHWRFYYKLRKHIISASDHKSTTT